MTTIFLAIVLGGAFGFSLDRVGATNPGYIIRMLNLSDLHLMKTILFAIGVASILMFSGLLVGLLDPENLSIKAAYPGVFIGGLLLGAVFAVSGFCPGTGLAAAATGRKDAWFFILGGLFGAGAYMLSYEVVAATGVLELIVGGKTTLATISGTKYPALFNAWPGEIVGVASGILFVALATALSKSLISK